MTTAGTINGLLSAQASARPDVPFIQCGEHELTFGAMWERARSVAAGLAALGVAAGDLVATLTTNRVEVLDLYFACAHLGAVQVPLNAAIKGRFLSHQLADAQARVLVADAAGAAAAADVLDASPDLKTLVCLDGTAGAPASLEAVPFDDLRADPAAAVEYASDASWLMSVLYTSGTTGLPKGCMLSNGYYVNVGRTMVDYFSLTEADVLFTALPLFHTGARLMVVAAALSAGCRVVVEPSFDAATYLARAREVGATVSAGVGAMAVGLLATPESANDREHDLRVCMWLPSSVALQKRFERRFGVQVTAQVYGQTECVPVTATPTRRPGKRSSAGRAAPHFEVRLVDDEGVPVATGEVGEITVRPRTPHSMFSGYWRNPDATLASFRNLWYHTGDYGRADAKGFITFVDRKKDALRRRGENVSSLELELAIVDHPAVLEVAVHAVPSEATEDDIKACLVLVPGATVTPEELADFFRATLPRFAVPRYVELVADLPKNALARVLKHELRTRGLTAETWDLRPLLRRTEE